MWIPVAAAVLATMSCAYYNTFYNARESYEEALELAAENPDDPMASEEELLQAAVEGAGKVLRDYSDSRWVDDAQLLLGDAMLQLGRRTLTGSGTSRFQEAMRAYSSVMVMTDDREKVDRAGLGMGMAAMELGRYGDAVASLEAVSGEDEKIFFRSRLLLAEALVTDGRPARALAMLDTLETPGDDSLRAELVLARGNALLGLGQADSSASVCLEAADVFGRGHGYFQAMLSASEAYIEAGEPSEAASVLERLLAGYRSDFELARISLLRGKAREMVGDTSAALSAYLNAAEKDPYREYGAEALYRRALLLEGQGRRLDAIDDLDELAVRRGDYLWIRLAENRRYDLELLQDYHERAETGSEHERERYRLMIAEKRRDLYGAGDQAALRELRELAGSDRGRIRAYARAALASILPADSSRAVLMEVRARADSSDLATMIEDSLKLPPGPAAAQRPSAILEAAWDDIEVERYQSAWERLDAILDSPWSYDVRPELLWAAYVAAEGSRQDDAIVEGYLRELAGDYPLTAEGREAEQRLYGLEVEDGEDGDGEDDGDGDGDGE